MMYLRMDPWWKATHGCDESDAPAFCRYESEIAVKEYIGEGPYEYGSRIRVASRAEDLTMDRGHHRRARRTHFARS
jgi:hypothetical protein